MSEKKFMNRVLKIKGLEEFEERSRKFFKKVGDTLDVVIADILDTAVFTLFPKIKQLYDEDESNDEIVSIAIFWDYDNFPILKNEDLDLFFDQIFPDSDSYNILTKKVFGLEEQLSRRKEVLRHVI